MSRRFTLPSLLAMLLFPLLATGGGVEPGAGELAMRLPGKYKLSHRGSLVRVEAVKAYHADGTYESKGTASVLGIERRLEHRGRWKLEDGSLVYTLTMSSTPKEAPVGVPLRFEVLSHDGKVLHYRDMKRGKVYSEQRMGDAGE